MKTPADTPGPPPPPSRSLAEVHGTVPIPSGGPWWRIWLAVTGPALMVSVGYMDPGNWATDIAGGSRYNYALIWVLLLSNLMAVLLQSFAARLGIVRRLDLAQANRATYHPAINFPLYMLAEIAITACDLAEVIGSAIALQLLFGLPLAYGVILTVLDVLLLLLLTRFGIRKLEAVVIALVGTIGIAFFVEILLARPEWGMLARGFVPSLPDSHALYIAIGILGATVMPHNIYLHSSLVQTRRIGTQPHELKRAIRWNTIDSAVALNLAFLVNAAILVMAAANFYRSGNTDVVEIQDAHRLLEPIVGTALAPVLFALALLASGQSSTVTGTLAGQIVMEGYLNLRIRPWLRRLLTRMLAVVPALVCIFVFGESSTGGLLVLSQVVLSLQLPFAIIPLLHFVADREQMGPFAIGPKAKLLGWGAAAIIVGLNIALVHGEVSRRMEGASPMTAIAVYALLGALLALLLYVTFKPLIERVTGRSRKPDLRAIHAPAQASLETLEIPAPYQRVAIALDFSGRQLELLAGALRTLGDARPRLILLHVTESPVARAFGRSAADAESVDDAARLELYASALQRKGFEVETRLGSGDQVLELARLVAESQADLVILGGHGHRGFKDWLHGTTADRLRHRVEASVLVVPLGSKT